MTLLEFGIFSSIAVTLLAFVVYFYRRKNNPGRDFYDDTFCFTAVIAMIIGISVILTMIGEHTVGDPETTGHVMWTVLALIYSILMMWLGALMLNDEPDKNNEVRREMKDDCGKCPGCKSKIDEAKKCAFEKMEKREDSKLYAGRKAILDNGVRCKIISSARDNDRDRPVFLVEEIKSSGKPDKYWVRFSDVMAWQEDDRDYSDMGKLRF